jgi:hypothetical protein
MVSVYLLVVIYLFYKKETFSKKEVGILLSVFAVIFLFSMVGNGRSYTASSFNVSYPLSKCNVTKENGKVIVVTPDSRKFVVKSDCFTIYEAADKTAETVEVAGQTRVYTSNAPDFVYKMYYLEDVAPSTEYVVSSINVSKVKN